MICTGRDREEIEKQMNELARNYAETHDPEIIKELYEFGHELEKMENRKAVWGDFGLAPLASLD